MEEDVTKMCNTTLLQEHTETIRSMQHEGLTDAEEHMLQKHLDNVEGEIVKRMNKGQVEAAESKFDLYTKNVNTIQRNTILFGAKELTEKSQVGFTREQLAKHINFNINIVNYWVRVLIDQNDILVDTSGMLSLDEKFLD